jgi:hypothetical protein
MLLKGGNEKIKMARGLLNQRKDIDNIDNYNNLDDKTNNKEVETKDNPRIEIITDTQLLLLKIDELKAEILETKILIHKLAKSAELDLK